MPADSWPAVLQGVQAEVGELGHFLAGGPDAEHPAGVLWSAVVGVEVVVQQTVCAWHCLMRNGGDPARISCH